MFLKKTCMSLTFCNKDLKKHFLMKIFKNFSEYISRKLKYHQHRIRCKTGILLEIILDLFKCFSVWLVPLKFLIRSWHHFCLFYLVSSVSLVWCQVCTFCFPLRNMRCTLLPEGTDVHIPKHIHEKGLKLGLPLLYYVKTLSCKTWNISILFVTVVNYNTNSFLRSFSFVHWSDSVH